MGHVREDVIFESEGVDCAGWLYVAKGNSEKKLPAIAMAHGLSAVKEMYDLPAFAEAFAAAGFVVLLFDYRYWGASDGEPRGKIFPADQIEDYRNALTYLSEHPDVDASRLGVWGTSMSGGHVLHLGAYDPRVKCVVSQVPAVNFAETLQRNMTPDGLAGFKELIIADRLQRYRTGEEASIPVNAPQGTSCLIPGEEAFQRSEREAALIPGVVRQCTLSSLEKMLEYNPAGGVRYIAPTPLFMIVAGQDSLTPTDLALDAFEKALEPKSLLYLSCGHYDVYKRECPEVFERASSGAVDWFTKHLGDI